MKTVAIKNAQLENIFMALEELSDKDTLNVALSFRIARIIKKLTDQAELFDEKRKEIIAKYAVLGDDGSPLEVDGRVNIIPERAMEFQDVFNALLNQVGDDVPAIYASELLDHGDRLVVKPMTLVRLGDLLIDDTDADVEVIDADLVVADE